MNNDEMYKRIMVMTSVKSAISYIKTCDINKSDFNKLCKKYNIFIEPKATKEEMIERFIDSTLRAKLIKKSANRHNTK